MSLIDIILLAIALAMDCFTVSIVSGLTTCMDKEKVVKPPLSLERAGGEAYAVELRFCIVQFLSRRQFPRMLLHGVTTLQVILYDLFLIHLCILLLSIVCKYGLWRD